MSTPNQRKQSEITEFTGKRRNQQKSPTSYASVATEGMKNTFEPVQNDDDDDEVLPDAKSNITTSEEIQVLLKKLIMYIKNLQ
jgi:hypothetical protein